MCGSRPARIGGVGAGICLIVIALLGWAGAGDRVLCNMESWRYPGSTVAAIGTAIMCVVELLRSPPLGGVLDRIPRRWRIVVPVGLSGVAGILWRVINGEQSWQEALSIGVFAGATAVFAHEAVVEALLGHSRRREECANGAKVPVAVVMGRRGP